MEFWVGRNSCGHFLGPIPSRAVSEMKRSMPPSLHNSTVTTSETFLLLFFVHRVHTIIWTWHYLANTSIKAPANYYSVRLFSLLISKHPFKPSALNACICFFCLETWAWNRDWGHRGEMYWMLVCCSNIVFLSFYWMLLFWKAHAVLQCAQTLRIDGDVDPQLWIFCHCQGRKKRKITDKRLQG